MLTWQMITRHSLLVRQRNPKDVSEEKKHLLLCSYCHLSKSCILPDALNPLDFFSCRWVEAAKRTTR